MHEGLSEEAKEIIEVCRESIGAYLVSRRVTLDAIEMLVGREPKQEAVQELVNAGLLTHIGQGMYYVVEI